MARNTELIAWNFVREQYETQFNKRHIPVALKYIILKFCKQIIGCNLLTFKEDLDFYNFLASKFNDKIK